jgi:hypothetical protein
MAAPTVIESLNTSTLCRKRKAADANLPERVEPEIVDTDMYDSDRDLNLMRFFSSVWSHFYRPELEKVFGPAPPGLDSVPATVPVSLPDIPSPVLSPLNSLTHGGGLDEDDEQYVQTQPYCDCECEDCITAANGPIDQFSDSE